MQCPYCHTPLNENSKECPSCQLSLYAANTLLKPMPRTIRGLNDSRQVLAKGANKRITTAITALERKFPQVDMHIMVSKFDKKFPLATHLFWLFNQGDFCATNRKGGKNHSILMGLDYQSGKIGLIVGYGLEPFLPMKTLDHTLERAQPLLASGNFGMAIITVITSLSELMESICANLHEALGIDLGEKEVIKEF